VGWYVVRVQAGARNFSLPRPDQLWGPHSLLSSGYKRLFQLEVKWPRLKADFSPPSSTEVKNVWSYTSLPQYASTAWRSVKQRSLSTRDIICKENVGLKIFHAWNNLPT
jgi:hypothetical protein